MAAIKVVLAFVDNFFFSEWFEKIAVSFVVKYSKGSEVTLAPFILLKWFEKLK